jgi:hypothetical protein
MASAGAAKGCTSRSVRFGIGCRCGGIGVGMGAGGMGMGAGAVDAEKRQVLVQLRGV